MTSNLNSLTKMHDAIRTLTRIQNAGYKSAVLAGGAIRDMYNNIPVNDYDLFLWDPYSSTEINSSKLDIDEEYISKLCGVPKPRPYEFASTGVTKYKPSAAGDYTINAHIATVWNVMMPEMDYQIIFVRHKPELYVQKYFDFGICKAYCDGNRIHLSEDFMTDISNQTITVCGEDMSKKMFTYSVTHHLPRIKRKYAGFKVIVSDHNVQHIDDHNKKHL